MHIHSKTKVYKNTQYFPNISKLIATFYILVLTYLTTKLAQSVNRNNGRSNLRFSQTCNVFLRLVTMKHHKPLYNAFVYITYSDKNASRNKFSFNYN